MSERFEARYLNSQTGFENSVLGFRPEPHVAQQRRRDKLRTNHTHDIPNHLLHLPNDPDLVHAIDQAMFSSEMLNFSMNTHGVLQQEAGGGLQSGRPLGPDDVTFGNSPKVVGPHWKGIGSQQPSCDWFVNYVNGAGGGNACNQNQNQTPLYVAEPLYGSHREANVSAFSTYPNHGYQDVVQPSYANTAIPIAAIPITSHQDCSKQYGDLNFSSPSFYHNALQEVVTSSTKGTQSDHCAWVDSGSEQVALPIYGNQFVATRVNNSESWMHRQLEGTSTQWNGEVENNRNVRHLDRVVGESTSRGLSLSLSSHSPSNVAQMGEKFIPENLQSRTGVCNGYQESKCNNSAYICSSSKPSTVNSFHGNSVQGVASTSGYPRRGIGPLGPFTGYATILKNSKFLKPAQLLLDEICNVAGSKLVRTCGSSERGSREASSSSSPIFAENETGRRGGSSDVSSSFNSSNQVSAGGKLGSGSCQAYNPEYQQKKAKLLYMQEEICRRYKQYHQQMQMVVSSFETVAGLSSATPYTSSALKAITRHFQCLRNAISDQINLITKTRGEEFLSPAVGITSKGDSTMSKLRCIDPNVRKQQAGGEYLSIIERQTPQHPIWRPQRGLPERAVAVLKAWLFEHFLHPYPTDTDKHMLATQTGLSRNQVSNWFINARVRVWKPMVEEMHMLETKGSTDTDHSSGNNPKLDSNGNVGCSGDQASNKLMIDAMSEKLPECSAVQSLPDEVGESSEQWPHHEKRFRVERQLPTTVDNGLISFIPYQHSGLGAVSLTLGLRHSTDHQQQHEHQLRHYGGQMIHDFVG